MICFGRPLKYLDILIQLEDKKLYKASTIADIPDWSHFSKEEERTERKRIRLAMGRLANSRDFPKFGDGTVSQPGQPPSSGWYGWRWKAAVIPMSISKTAKVSISKTEKASQEYIEVFAPDEQKLLPVSKDWTKEKLLNQKAVFFLKDVAEALIFDPRIIKHLATEITNEGKKPWQVVGAAQVFKHWMIRMATFSIWYRDSVFFNTKKPQWNGGRLLEETGMFLLNDVCARMPVSIQMIRAQVRKTHEKAQDKLGVWKDEKTGVYLVEMEPFSTWIREKWGDLIRYQGLQR